MLMSMGLHTLQLYLAFVRGLGVFEQPNQNALLHTLCDTGLE